LKYKEGDQIKEKSFTFYELITVKHPQIEDKWVANQNQLGSGQRADAKLHSNQNWQTCEIQEDDGYPNQLLFPTNTR